MNEIAQYLKDAQTYYLATMEQNHPRVRPFGTVAELEGKIYIATSNNKDVYKQMVTNPKVEISCMVGDTWLRLSGTVTTDSSIEARKAFLEAMPSMKKLYSIDDGIYEVLYFTKATASICSMGKEPKIITL